MPTCESCGRETPDENFCTWCGAPRQTPVRQPAWRTHHFAAHPGEHVLHPSVVSTLLPHLPSHRLHEFRWGLLAGVGLVVALVGAGVISAAIVAAAVLVPVLYLVYLYESQVYRDEPIRTLALTIVAGVAIGIAVMVVAGVVIPAGSPLELGLTGSVLGATVVLPVIEEIVKPLPTLFLRRLAKFGETIDGLVFGVSVGLGFSAAETIFNFSRIIDVEPLHASSSSWLFPMLSAAVLIPLMQASCTGAFTASIWRAGRRQRSRLLYLLGAPVAIVGHVAFSLVSWVLLDHGASEAIVLFWQAAVAAGLLVYIRFLLHRSLLDEAADLGYRAAVCPHCRRHVEAAGFCPHCGAALTASPRTGHGGLRSDRPVPLPSGGSAAPAAEG